MDIVIVHRVGLFKGDDEIEYWWSAQEYSAKLMKMARLT